VRELRARQRNTECARAHHRSVSGRSLTPLAAWLSCTWHTGERDRQQRSRSRATRIASAGLRTSGESNARDSAAVGGITRVCSASAHRAPISRDMMLHDADLVADCKDEITTARRSATRAVFVGAAASAAVLFVPWGAVTTAPLGAVLVPLFAICAGLAALIVPRWPVASATLMTAILHLLPLVTGECAGPKRSSSRVREMIRLQGKDWGEQPPVAAVCARTGAAPVGAERMRTTRTSLDGAPRLDLPPERPASPRRLGLPPRGRPGQHVHPSPLRGVSQHRLRPGAGVSVGRTTFFVPPTSCALGIPPSPRFAQVWNFRLGDPAGRPPGHDGGGVGVSGRPVHSQRAVG